MIIGYARTSTVEQIAGLEVQLKDLNNAGCKKIYSEQVSSVQHRTQLQNALDFCREGDVFVVTKIDRLARSVSDLMEVISQLEKKNVTVRILNFGMDTNTPTGKLMLVILGGIAQFEREMMLERQREGIAKAQKDGKYRGRKPLSNDIKEKVLKMISEGMSKRGVAREMNLCIASVCRIFNKAR